MKALQSTIENNSMGEYLAFRMKLFDIKITDLLIVNEMI